MLKKIEDLEKTATEKIDQPIAHLQKELGSIRTGRATPAILDGVQVDYFNTPTPINQLASVSAPESRLIVIQPWDPTVLGEMEKAILRANLGLTPTNDGKVIRISIPALTEERRKELVKVAKKMAEEGRVALRSVRRELNEQVKDLEKKKEISEDQMHTAQGEVKKIKKPQRIDEFTRLDPETRLVLVGDASMAPYELMATDGSIHLEERSGMPSIECLKFLADTFSHAVWLNPVPESMWDYTRTIHPIREIFPMFELSIDGLEKAIIHLMAK